MEVIRQSIFYFEGTEVEATIAMTNLSKEGRSFNTTITSYPYELRDLKTHLQITPRIDKINAETTRCFENKFFTSWDGRWSFNVTTIGTDLTNKTAAESGFGTGDIKIHPLPTKLADDVNEDTKQLLSDPCILSFRYQAKHMESSFNNAIGG